MFIRVLIPLLAVLLFVGCQETADDIQRRQSNALQSQALSSVGMPNIKNFRELRLLKDLLELRDQEGVVTYTYLFSEQTGKLIYLGQTIGYGIPYAAQFTNPQKWDRYGSGEVGTLPQAEPNGIFSPDSAEGTWIFMADPNGGDPRPVYVEPRILVSPFKLNL